MRRKRCVYCRKLTEKWQRINGGSWHCYDGCLSTTGKDRRVWAGPPYGRAGTYRGEPYR